MRRATTALMVAAVGVSWTLAWPIGIAAEEKDKPDLTGRWQLNKEKSEDARAKIEEARSRNGGGGGMGGGRPGGGGGRGGGMGGGRPGGGRGPGSGAPGGGGMRQLLEPPERLTITGNASELTFDDGQGALVKLQVDGKARKREDSEAEVKASWKDGALVVETTMGEGRAKLTTTYARKEAGTLDVLSKLEGRMGAVSVKRVYDAAKAE